MAEAAWIDNLKTIVLQAVAAGDPCNWIPGVVVSVSPVAVQIDQKITVKGSQVLIPQRLTNHTQTMVLPEIGEVAVTVKNELKAGDRVLLLQKKGGQQFLVLDRW